MFLKDRSFEPGPGLFKQIRTFEKQTFVILFWSWLASVPPKYIVCYLGVEYLESDGMRLIREVSAVPLTSRQLSRPTPGAPNLANRPTVLLSYFLLWVCYETQ